MAKKETKKAREAREAAEQREARRQRIESWKNWHQVDTPGQHSNHDAEQGDWVRCFGDVALVVGIRKGDYGRGLWWDAKLVFGGQSSPFRLLTPAAKRFGSAEEIDAPTVLQRADEWFVEQWKDMEVLRLHVVSQVWANAAAAAYAREAALEDRRSDDEG